MGTGYVLAVAGFAVGVWAAATFKPAEFAPKDGFSALALFYIAAQAIERFLEPITGFVRAPAPAGTGGGSETKDGAANNRDQELAIAHQAAAFDDKQAHTLLAAEWQKVVDIIRSNTKVLAWGAATGMGAAVAGRLGLFLMQAVGAKGVPTWLDVVVTGIVIGGGSKTLHDLISNLEKAKETKEDKPKSG